VIFVNAALLILVQPMLGKMVLPRLGGTPAVWNTCLVFYQAMFLLGCLYVYGSLQWLQPHRQAILHLLVLCLPWIVLPVHFAEDALPAAEAFPTVWLWSLLAASAGLPLIVISANVPLLQAWFGRRKTRSARDPYFLLATGSLGGVLAVLAYPVLIESHLTLSRQALIWAIGYGFVMVLMAVCSLELWRSPLRGDVPRRTANGGTPRQPSRERLTWRRRVSWVLLALVPSSLLMGVTSYISTDVGQVILLWALPLAAYLLTFALVFERGANLRLPGMRQAEPWLVVMAVAAFAWRPDTPVQLLVLGSLELLAFFVIALVCHGQLAASRPSGRRLTEFYVWMALGALLGGLVNSVAAPWVFANRTEYPLMLAAACLLRPVLPAGGGSLWAKIRISAFTLVLLVLCGGLLWAIAAVPEWLSWRYANFAVVPVAVMGVVAAGAVLLRHHRIAFALAVFGLMVVCWCYPCEQARVLLAKRDFFGPLRVNQEPAGSIHTLVRGGVVRGSQDLDPSQRREPAAPYRRVGPLGRIFLALQPRRPLGDIGVVGLGTGAIAAYGRADERITFFAIDPAVEQIARDPRYFTYLADSRAEVEVVLGDVRHSLGESSAREFDLLIIDLFSVDTSPIQLITKEALAVYQHRLAKHGLLAFHVSHHYLNLLPVLGRLADEAGMVALVSTDFVAENSLKNLSSTWVVMARHVEDLLSVTHDSPWEPLTTDGGRVWSDDFADVLDALQWQSLQNASPSKPWWQSQQEEVDSLLSAAQLLCEQNRFDEALTYFQKVLEVDAENVAARDQIGLILQKQGKTNQAIGYYEKALKIEGDNAKIHFNLALALQIQGRFAKAAEHYEKALLLSPNYSLAANNLAWLRATCPDSSVRNGQRASELAERTISLADEPNAGLLDTLAAAYAETGRFDEAVEAARDALELAKEEDDTTMANSISERLALYEARTPFRETPPQNHNARN
jgi:tetratricopeptide (TPR) repeat protein